jgi:hypothetical protein
MTKNTAIAPAIRPQNAGANSSGSSKPKAMTAKMPHSVCSRRLTFSVRWSNHSVMQVPAESAPR